MGDGYVGSRIRVTEGLTSALRPGPITLAIGLAAATASLLLIHLSLLDVVPDDAYIHLRVARNLIEHGEPYFNLGEAVKASSSTLWTLVIASIFRLTGVALWPIAVLNSLLLVSAGIVYGVLTSIAFPHRRFLRWVAGSLVVAALLPTSVDLMETGLAVFLIGVAWVLLQRKQPAGFAVGAVAVFARPEMAIFMALVIFGSLSISSFRLRTIASIGGLASLPFLAFDLAFFRTVVPHAAVAKSIVFPVTLNESLSVTRFPMEATLAGPYLLLGVLAVVVLWAVSAPDRSKTWLLVSFSAAGSAVLFFYVLAGTFVFPWYQPLFVVPAVLSGVWILAITRRSLPWLAAVALCIPSVWFASTTVMDSVEHKRLLEPVHPDLRVGQFRAVALVLQDECLTCNLLAPEIGALGHYFEGYVIDAMGLVTPNALKYHPLEVPSERVDRFTGGIPVGLVAEFSPDFIVTLSGFAESLLASSIMSEYRVLTCPVAQPVGWNGPAAPSIFGMSELLLMVRRDRDDLSKAFYAGVSQIGCVERRDRL